MEDFIIDDDFTMEEKTIIEPKKEVVKTKKSTLKKEVEQDTSELVNCLRNERIIVRHIPRKSMVDNPKHILYGGMADDAVKTYSTPKLESGQYVNVLTKQEKDFLEDALGLEYNALSVFKKPESENFWNDSNPLGLSRVSLTKQDNYFNLASPEDYVKYKILLANKNSICPSLQTLEDKPKATYEFVIIKAEEESDVDKVKMNATMECYKEYGKIENDRYLLKTVIEIYESRPLAKSTKLIQLQTKVNELIQHDSRLFLKIIKDPLLQFKSILRQGVEEGVVAMRGNYYYLKNDNTPFCEQDEEPTLNNAARYISNPKHSETLFAIQAKLNK